MKKTITLFLLLFVSNVFAQNFSGEAIYQSITTLDIKMDSTRFTAEQLKMMKERMSKALQKEYALSFNSTTSLWKEIEQLDEGERRMGPMIMMMTGGASLLYKDIKTKEMLDQTEFFGKEFLITDSLDILNWKLGNENKMIGSYTCYKATAKRDIITKTLDSENPNTGYDTTTIDLVAWYSPQIPVSNGPVSYWGLPGLILELKTDRTTYLCSKITLKPNEVLEIKKPKKGERVSRMEYTDIIMKKMEEMREVYGNERRGNSSGPRPGRGRIQIQITR